MEEHFNRKSYFTVSGILSTKCNGTSWKTHFNVVWHKDVWFSRSYTNFHPVLKVRKLDSSWSLLDLGVSIIHINVQINKMSDSIFGVKMATRHVEFFT